MPARREDEGAAAAGLGDGQPVEGVAANPIEAARLSSTTYRAR